MSTSNTVHLTDEVFNKMREEVDDFFATHEAISSSVEYENKLIELAQKFASKMLAAGAGQLPKDRNLKKSADDLGSL